MFLHTWHPQSILWQAGPLAIHWYGLTLAVGAIIGFFITRVIAKKYSINDVIIVDLFLTVVITGFIGARLYHVGNEWAYYRLYPTEIIKIWHGGLAWHGGLIGGLIGLIGFSRMRKISFWTLTDVLVPGVVVGQAIGRWGNYFNQELFGRPTSLPWGIPIDVSHRPLNFSSSKFFHPTFLYESLGLLLIFTVVWWLHRRRLNHHPLLGTTKRGTIALVYLILAASLRIATELLRVDRTPVLSGVRLPILSGVIIITVAIIVWILLTRSTTSDHAA